MFENVQPVPRFARPSRQAHIAVVPSCRHLPTVRFAERRGRFGLLRFVYKRSSGRASCRPKNTGLRERAGVERHRKYLTVTSRATRPTVIATGWSSRKQHALTPVDVKSHDVKGTLSRGLVSGRGAQPGFWDLQLFVAGYRTGGIQEALCFLGGGIRCGGGARINLNDQHAVGST